MKIVRGAKVCVTGAASGIGRATAIAMARRGAVLFLTDINAAGLEETSAMVVQAGGTVGLSSAFDISNYDAMAKFAAAIHESHGALDVLINNAGIALFSLVENMTHEHWKRIIDVDLWGPIHGVECFVPAMIRARKGHVVTVSSTAGLVGLPWHAAYSTAKFGLVGLSEVLRYDLRQHGVDVTVICPGAVKTPIQQAVTILGADRETPEARKVEARFLRHAVTPERVAELIIQGIEKRRFLVITSGDIKVLYFLKRVVHPVFHMVLCKISDMMNSLSTPTRNVP
jgi:NAD(P)-dependent dehydrogenase (short-subunit alcohol dehydrogenase family)